MKRRITLSIALALSIAFVSLTTADSTARAQPQNLIRVDTGNMVLGPGQVLRIMAEWTSPGAAAVRFKRIEYGPGACSDGVCKHTVASVTASDVMTLTNGQAASFDIPAAFSGGVFVGVRGVVERDRRDVRVTGMIMDATTGKVVAALDLNDLF